MEVLKEEGDWRLSLGVDEYPEKPYDEGGWPVLRIHPFYNEAAHVDNSAAPLDEQKECTERAVRHWYTKPSDRGDWKLFEKWLRVYLGVTRIETYYSGEYWYVAYDSAAWREWAGVTPEQTATEDPLAEIRAWVEGEVYFYTLEKRVTWPADGYPDRQTWETVESCGGLYGSKWAEQAALEAWEAV